MAEQSTLEQSPLGEFLKSGPEEYEAAKQAKPIDFWRPVKRLAQRFIQHRGENNTVKKP